VTNRATQVSNDAEMDHRQCFSKDKSKRPRRSKTASCERRNETNVRRSLKLTSRNSKKRKKRSRRKNCDRKMRMTENKRLSRRKKKLSVFQNRNRKEKKFSS